jgi:short-subunit dehydrogenase
MSYNPFSLDSKTILITGASSGIGRTTAVECSKMGAKVVITGRNEQRLQDTFERLEGDGHMQIVADLATSEGIASLVEKMPVVNGCVNNAGYNVMQLISFIKEEDADTIFKVNALAPIMLTSLMVKKKKLQKEGSIVFT